MTEEELILKMCDETGAFAENKDKARELRLRRILPALNEGKTVILDFARVDSATQSFIHALISDVIRKKGISVLDRLFFKNCNEVVKTVIEIVVDYMQEPPRIIKPNGKDEAEKSGN